MSYFKLSPAMSCRFLLPINILPEMVYEGEDLNYVVC